MYYNAFKGQRTIKISGIRAALEMGFLVHLKIKKAKSAFFSIYGEQMRVLCRLFIMGVPLGLAILPL